MGTHEQFREQELLSAESHKRLAHACAEALKALPILVNLWPEKVGDTTMAAYHLVPDAELRSSALRSMQNIAKLLASGELPDEYFARELGSSRAESGVPLGDVMKALNADFELVWNAINKADPTLPSSAVRLLGERVWLGLGTYTNVVLQAFRDREISLTAALHSQWNAAINRLIVGRIQQESVIRASLTATGLADASRYTAAVSFTEPHLGPKRTGERKMPYIVGRTESGAFASIISSTEEFRRFNSSLACLIIDDLRVADLSHGISALLTGISAETLIDGWTHLHDNWLSASTTRTGVEADFAAREILRAIHTEPTDTVARHAAAVEALWHHRSFTDAAATMFCHRNTLVQRCEKMYALSGLDARVPRDLALLRLGFQFLDLAQRETR